MAEAHISGQPFDKFLEDEMNTERITVDKGERIELCYRGGNAGRFTLSLFGPGVLSVVVAKRLNTFIEDSNGILHVVAIILAFFVLCIVK